MGTAYNVESSQFVESALRIQTEHKTGQYTKYLDSAQYFCDYYPINTVFSRTDIGTKATYDEIGPDSPIRYNHIKNYPLYINNKLVPNINYEDGLLDTDIEISDITFLPNTLIPKPGDFIKLKFPNSPALLFIVTEFKNVTIQSNNFYQASAILRFIGDDNIKIDAQVIENYTCIFENIGTQDNCIIRDDVLLKASSIKKSFDDLSGFYHDMYYDKEIGTYAYNDEFDLPHITSQPPKVDLDMPYDMGWNNVVHNFFSDGSFSPARQIEKESAHTYYDVYLIKFIKDSDIFFDPHSSASSAAISYDDFNPPTFDLIFRQSLWYAVLKNDITLLKDYMYYYTHDITKMTSTLLTHRKPNPTGFTLINTINSNTSQMDNYLSNVLIDFIKHGKPEVKVIDSNILDTNIGNTNIVNLTPIQYGNTEALTSNAVPELPIENDSVLPDDQYDDINYTNTFDFIYNYMTNRANNIDYKLIFNELMQNSVKSYWFTPLVLYIMKQQYNLIMHRSI